MKNFQDVLMGHWDVLSVSLLAGIAVSTYGFHARVGNFKVRRQFWECYGHENARNHSRITL